MSNGVKRNPYLVLFTGNAGFRRLFIGQFISQTGDWFNSVAPFSLIAGLTGSGQSVAYVYILKLLPAFFLSPVAGVAADRFNRKHLMIAADV